MVNNEHGITLVEVLAVFVIGSIISVIGIQLLMSGFKSYEHATVQAELRDEADLIMAHLVEDLFTTTTKEVKEDPDMSRNIHFFLLKNGERIGFVNGKVYTKNGEIISANRNIELDLGTRIEKVDDAYYKIFLVLNKGEHSLALESEISLINAEDGGN